MIQPLSIFQREVINRGEKTNVQYFHCVQVPKIFLFYLRGIFPAPPERQQPHRVQMGRALIYRL
jgi:hypothetical protein